MLVDEEQQVEAWRLGQFLRYDEIAIGIAEILAGSDVDVHVFARLVENGCSPQLAAEILL